MRRRGMRSAFIASGIVASSLALGSCGGDKDSGTPPTTPSRQAATVSVIAFGGSASQTSAQNAYDIRAVLEERSGLSGAAVNTIELTFSDGNGTIASVTFSDAWSSSLLAAGTRVILKNIRVGDSRDGRRLATRVTARIPYTDDTQVPNAVTVSADIVPPAGPPAPATAGVD
jgi:hypothetical protein